MPRQEIYTAINHPERQFMSRAEYLDYLRVRWRERRSWERLEAARAKALDRLRAVHQCQDWTEVQDFLNDHAPDIDFLSSRTKDHICDIQIRIRDERICRVGYDAPVTKTLRDGSDAPVWIGRLIYSYRKGKPSLGEPMRDRYPYYHLPYRAAKYGWHNDVLGALGLHTGSGGGANPYGYELTIFQTDFDHLRVMSRLAA